MSTGKIRRAWKASPAAVIWDGVSVAVACWIVYAAVTDVMAGRIRDIVIDAIVAGLAAYYLKGRPRYYRTEAPALRRSLLAAARKIGEGEIWLNRAEHVVFMCHRDFSSTQVRAIDENDFRRVDIDSQGTVIDITYIMVRTDAGIIRKVGGTVIAMLDDGTATVAATERKSEWRKWREAWQMTRDMRRGYHDTDATEMQKVISQIAGAEKIGPASPEGTWCG